MKDQPGSAFVTKPWVVLLLPAALATLIYSNTFSSSFHFDDIPNIVENQQIRNLKNLLDLAGSRYVGYLSFALNYTVGGLHVFGYHLVNLLIHITNAWLVYKLVRLLGRTPGLAKTWPPVEAAWIALATALLFVVHPIQTQAVTYIVQRFASLATLFYLLAIVCYLHWRLTPGEAKNRGVWYGIALFATVLAMKTKEISFTLPAMLILIEAVFLRHLSRPPWLALTPFLLTLFIIPLSRIDAISTPGRLEAEIGLARETAILSRQEYLLTQFRVLVTYLRFLVWPVNQNLDHDYPVSHSLLDPAVLGSALVLSSLIVGALWLLVRAPSSPSCHHRRFIAFGIVWFFLTLSIESSIIPIRDVIMEHRLYLPSVGAFLTFSVAITHGLNTLRADGHRKGAMAILMLSIIPLSVATYQRNAIWKDELTLWTDVVQRSPKKARAHHDLGVAYNNLGRFEEAIKEYQITLKLKPTYLNAHYNLGNAYQALGRPEEAIEAYQTALKLNPNNTEAYNNLGNAYQALGRLEEAIMEYQRALALNPTHLLAHYNLGVAYARLGHQAEAIQAYQAALKLQPDFVQAHSKLANAYMAQGRLRLEEAIQEYQVVLRLRPDSAQTHNALGQIYTMQGRLDEAMLEYQAAIKLQPTYAAAHNNLGMLYMRQGRVQDAIEAFQRALKAQPDLAIIHYHLGGAYLRAGRISEAISEFERTLQLQPDSPAARRALEALSP